MHAKRMDTNKILAKLGISELNAMQQEAMDTILRRNDDVVILSRRWCLPLPEESTTIC